MFIHNNKRAEHFDVSDVFSVTCASNAGQTWTHPRSIHWPSDHTSHRSRRCPPPVVHPSQTGQVSLEASHSSLSRSEQRRSLLSRTWVRTNITDVFSWPYYRTLGPGQIITVTVHDIGSVGDVSDSRTAVTHCSLDTQTRHTLLSVHKDTSYFLCNDYDIQCLLQLEVGCL